VKPAIGRLGELAPRVRFLGKNVMGAPYSFEM